MKYTTNSETRNTHIIYIYVFNEHIYIYGEYMLYLHIDVYIIYTDIYVYIDSKENI